MMKNELSWKKEKPPRQRSIKTKELVPGMAFAGFIDSVQGIINYSYCVLHAEDLVDNSLEVMRVHALVTFVIDSKKMSRVEFSYAKRDDEFYFYASAEEEYLLNE